MSGIILYQSKYGASRKYAQWLAEETGFSCAEVKKTDPRSLSAFDTIILGGGIYASGIAGLGFLRKNIGSIKEKKLAVYCCGASPYDEKALKEIIERNMKNELSGIPCFYCRGAWDMSAMSFADRTLCGMLRKAVSKKNPEDYELWEKALMEAGDDSCDWTDKKYLAPILEYIGK